MWHWDQGRLVFFQFETIQRLARYALHKNIRTASREDLLDETGTDFPAPPSYSPWRNYSRVFKICLLVDGTGTPTPVARILSEPGVVTCDEYFHFLVSSFTDPSPALSNWNSTAVIRYPLLFALKYLLAKKAIRSQDDVSFDEIIGVYQHSDFVGNEGENDFASIIQANQPDFYCDISLQANKDLRRQARESLLAIAQISYLHVVNQYIHASLHPDDAHVIFNDLAPLSGNYLPDRDQEIVRRSQFFSGGSTYDFFDYPHTMTNDVVQSGFNEGEKVQKTHLVIERNSGISRDFFASQPTAVCDMCSLDTNSKYPWTNRILDLHHLLPLASGTRVVGEATTFEDLVPVCPNCHRAIHRFYGNWLRDKAQKDFSGRDESRHVYNLAKESLRRL